MRQVWLGIATLCLSTSIASPAGAQVRLHPEAPLVEKGSNGGLIGLDIEVTAPDGAPSSVGSIEVAYLDDSGRPLLIRSLDLDRGIDGLANRMMNPGERRILYNPFPLLPPDVRPAAVRVGVVFYDPTTEHSDTRRVLARHTASATLGKHSDRPFLLPVTGRVFVWDGHGETSHHRRYDFSRPFDRSLGIRGNAARYSYDFVPVDADDRMTRGCDDKNECYIGFRQPVRAPGGGRVVEARGDRMDNRRFSLDDAKGDMNATFGNYVVIDHEDGRYSILGHLAEGSVTVKPGDRVKPGQTVGAIGASGSSLFPHLHYQVMDAPSSTKAEGIPSYFRGLARARGAKVAPVAHGAIDSGDVLLAK